MEQRYNYKYKQEPMMRVGGKSRKSRSVKLPRIKFIHWSYVSGHPLLFL